MPTSLRRTFAPLQNSKVTTTTANAIGTIEAESAASVSPELLIGFLRLETRNKKYSERQRDHGSHLLSLAEYGGLQIEQTRLLKDLQKEHAQLKRALATLTLEKQVLKDIAEGNF